MALLSFTTIRSRLILLVGTISAGMGLLVGLLVPPLVKTVGRQVVDRKIGFIEALLQENLAVGMQARELDEGAALNQTLKSLKEIGGSAEVVENIIVFCRGVFKSGILGASKSGKRAVFSEVGW